MFDPLKLAETMEKIVVKDRLRKYYRVARAGRWYGGSVAADCVGCCLRCVFCWSGLPRDRPEDVGKFYAPEYVFRSLVRVARKRRYRLLRISGNEPTIGRRHLLEFLECLEGSDFIFILETNGILIGHDKSYARALSKFSRVHVRVSLKGTCPEEFSRLTGAKPEFFEYQFKALQNLLDYGVSCHPAVMLSFSSKENRIKLMKRLQEIDPVLVEEFEEEYVFLYPHVVERLKRAGIKPLIAYTPDNIPAELV